MMPLNDYNHKIMIANTRKSVVLIIGYNDGTLSRKVVMLKFQTIEE